MSKLASRIALLALTLALAALWAPAPAAAQPDAGKIRIVVLPFEVNAGPELDYLKDSLPELLGDRLKEDGFSLVDQETVGKLIHEHEVEYLDLATAKDLALLSDATWAVYGSFSQVGETISLDVRLVEAYGVKPAKPLFVVQDGLINAVPAIEDLAAKIKLELLRKERIESVDVTGTKVLDKDVVLLRLRTKQGDIYDPKALNEEIKSIYELGYFDDVQVQVDDLPEGMAVTFAVKEKPLIQVVDVLGVEELDKDDILALMSTRAGSVMNPKLLADDLGKIKSEYRKEGYYNATVGYELEKSDEGQARLNVKVEEGKKLYIENIRIVGAKEMDEDDLKDELALGERGMFSWFTGTGVLKEEYLNRDSAALESYYNNHGFIEAQVGQPKVEYLEDGISITFEVVEGRRYKIGKISYEGDLLETTDKLNELIEADDKAAEEEYLDRSLLRADTQKLTEYYSNYGYAFAEADYVLHADPETLTADVVFELHKRQKIYIRRVTIEGNTRTRDNVVRRELRLTDGDLFSGKKLARSTERLNLLGFFEQADIRTVPTDDPGLMDLKVRVKETTTGELSAGAGWSSSDGLYMVARIAERNLFGKGYFASLEGTLGGDSSRYQATFVNPRYNDSPWYLGGDLFLTRDNYDEYDRTSKGARVRTGRAVGEYSEWGIAYTLERYKIDDVDDDAYRGIREMRGDHTASSLYTDIVRSTLDRYMNPTKGMKSYIAFTYSGGLLMGNDDFLRTVADHSQYFPLWFDHVFHVHGQAGVMVEQPGSDEDIPISRKFYLGGMQSVRGYKSRYISPRDGATGDRIGGDREAFANFEYLFPIMDEAGVQGLFFFDAGQVWDEDESLGLDWEKSVGLGIRWYSPMGPLRLEYGYALDTIREQGSKGKLEFTIGQFF